MTKFPDLTCHLRRNDLKYYRAFFTGIWISYSLLANANDTPSRCTLTSDFAIHDASSLRTNQPHLGTVVTKLEYADANAIEWQIRLEAPESENSPTYSDLRSADFVVEFPNILPIALHWSRGSHSAITDFEPRTEPLNLGSEPVKLESFGGRSSDGCMPYFNISSEDGGLIVAIGWTGDWMASFDLVAPGQVQVTAGLKRSHFQLQPGENLRLPSILVMSYRGDWISGQNKFRQLMLKHFTPKTVDPVSLMPVAASIHGMIAFNETTEANVIDFAESITASKLPVDTIWLDAGWNEGGFPGGQGNPNTDPIRYPNGLRLVGQAVEKTGKRFLTWFEPERAMRGTWLAREHADWNLMPTKTPDDFRYMENDGFQLVDFGNPKMRAWAVETISREIGNSSIKIYRQDFNEYPSYFWHTNEKPSEIGLNEVRYINGLYLFFDELAQRHPGLIIDNCASGGRRLDFEMMRRSVCLWRSDSCWDDKTYPRNVQAMTHGLSHWLPLHGLGSVSTDPVSLRSGMGACVSYAINYRDPKAVEELRSFLRQYLEVRSLFAADFYPLTSWTDDTSKWLAFQYNDPAKNEGIVQAFRLSNPNDPSTRLNLRGLDPNRSYVVHDWDNPNADVTLTGDDMMKRGIEIKPGTGSQAIFFHYQPR